MNSKDLLKYMNSVAAPGIKLSGGAQTIQSGHRRLCRAQEIMLGTGDRSGVITQILHHFFNKIENPQQAEPSCDHHHRYLDGATNKNISIFG